MSIELDKSYKEMREGFRISNHTFVSLAIQGLSKRLNVASDKIKITPANKTDRSNVIKVELLSQHIADSSDDLADTKSAVDALMQELKNEVNLINMLGK